MGKRTAIDWTDHTHNWWWGCNEVTPEECGLGLPAGCYARDFARSARGGSWNGTQHPVTGAINPEIWGPPRTTTRRIFGDTHNAEPYVWNAAAMKRGERMCAFAESMSDLFEFHPLLDAPRRVAFRTIENTAYLDWKMLTKRIQLVSRYVPQHWMDGQWPLNAWIGFSAGNQQFFDERVRYAIDLPAPVIFVSHEPATGPINIEKLARAVDASRFVDYHRRHERPELEAVPDETRLGALRPRPVSRNGHCVFLQARLRSPTGDAPVVGWCPASRMANGPWRCRRAWRRTEVGRLTTGEYGNGTAGHTRVRSRSGRHSHHTERILGAHLFRSQVVGGTAG